MIFPARIFRIFLSILLILVGIAGLVLPILPGIYFIVAGMLLLVEAVPAWRVRFQKLERRYPRLQAAMKRFKSPDGNLDLTKIIIVSLAIVLIFGTMLWLVFYLVGTGIGR